MKIFSIAYIVQFADNFAGLLIMPRARPTCRVYIGNLPSRIHLSDIEHFFRRYKRRFDILMKTGFAFIVSSDFSFSEYIFLRPGRVAY